MAVETALEPEAASVCRICNPSLSSESDKRKLRAWIDALEAAWIEHLEPSFLRDRRLAAMNQGLPALLAALALSRRMHAAQR